MTRGVCNNAPTLACQLVHGESSNNLKQRTKYLFFGWSFKGIIWSQKRGKSVVFLWSKVFLDKGIANRTIQWPELTRSFSEIKNQPIQSTNEQKRPENSHLLAELHSATVYWLLWMDLDSTWQHAHNRAFDEVFTCARAVWDSASTYLVVCRFNPSTNSLTVRDICGRAAGNWGQRQTDRV